MSSKPGGPTKMDFERTLEHASPERVEIPLEGDDIYRWERTQEHEPRHPFSSLSFQRVKARLIHFERPVRHMYLDSRNNVTAGIGYMIPNERKLRDYQWVAKGTGRKATDAELLTDWKEVLKYKGRGWRAEAFGRWTHVEITIANMNVLLQKKIYVYDQELRVALKRWNEMIKEDPVTYAGAVAIQYGEQPPPVLEAMFDMIYTLGRTHFLGYPKMLTAIGRRDWARAAEQSNRPQLGAERNQAIKTLFLASPAGANFAESWEPARDLWGSSESR